MPTATLSPSPDLAPVPRSRLQLDPQKKLELLTILTASLLPQPAPPGMKTKWAINQAEQILAELEARL